MSALWQQVDAQTLFRFLNFHTRYSGIEMVLRVEGQIVYDGRTAGQNNTPNEVFCVKIEGESVGQLQLWHETKRSPTPSERRQLVAEVTLHFELAHEKQQNVAIQQRLIEEIKAHAELEEALKFMELRALQSQLNPHFLFNTLSTLAGLAMVEEAHKTEGLIYALARILRYSLRHITQTVTIEEELKHVIDYCNIQSVRFGDRITIDFNVDERIYSTQIPVLTLQPLVENAIIHGLESMAQGRLEISGYLEDGSIVLQVEDNGVGISEAKLRQVQHLEVDISGRSHITGIGLTNVHKRLQHFYGKAYGIQINSQPGQGTQVVIRLPF